MEIRILESSAYSGERHVIVDDKWADGLTKDEALGVVASALFSGNPLYVLTNEQYAAKAERFPRYRPVALLPAPAIKEDALIMGLRFMQELLDSVETLAGIAEAYGARTLADLMYLQQAILSGGFIDHYPEESKVLDIVQSLPSGEKWAKFIKVEYMAQEA